MLKDFYESCCGRKLEIFSNRGALKKAVIIVTGLCPKEQYSVQLLLKEKGELYAFSKGLNTNSFMHAINTCEGWCEKDITLNPGGIQHA